MPGHFLAREGTPLPSNVKTRYVVVDGAQWTASAQHLHEAGACLLTLWGADDRDRSGSFCIYAAFLRTDQVVVLQHAMPAGTTVYPALSRWFPVADRLQRAVYDLLGLQADGGDTRPWLRHGGWPQDCFPLRRDVSAATTYPSHPRPYPFVPVMGEGVHEIGVGPVHAGTIEPGHFRFSVVGEKVLRLEEQLGYTHKGVAKRFEALTLQEGHRLAARISGDSAVAFSWAYCAALEAITSATVSPRAAYLRALALERERIANHLGDLGALGNDAGLAFGLMQFSILKERLLRLNQEAFDQRYLMDYIAPGGVRTDLGPRLARSLLDESEALERDVSALRAMYDDHPGLQDRFRDAGQLTPALAKAQGALGLAARASGIKQDLRIDLPWSPYDDLHPVGALRVDGDVAARVQVRFDEIMESLRLSRVLLERLPAGPTLMDLPPVAAAHFGLGLIEGWRGPVLVALAASAPHGIRRCHVHDPSWQNWPLLEHAIIGNIVPDFPLINKSFNLAYSGHDG